MLGPLAAYMVFRMLWFYHEMGGMFRYTKDAD
jgi:hypothetical protein